MTDKNTLSIKNYILLHAAGLIPLLLFVRFAAGIPFSFSMVFLLLWSVLLGCYYTVRKRRSFFTLFLDLLTPAELIVLITYRTRRPVLTLILFAAWLLLSAVYAGLVLHAGKRRRKRMRISRGQLRWSLLGSRTIFAFVMIAALLSLSVLYSPPPIPTQVPVESLGCTVEDCAVSLDRLSPCDFDTFDTDERLEVLRDVCRVEFTALGIDHGFTVDCGDLGDLVLAEYSDADYTVTVNSRYIGDHSSFSLMYAMCHESYHAYQHCLIRTGKGVGYRTEEELKSAIETYTEEFSHYASPHEDIEKYRSQQCETDANLYADEACLKYLRFYGI